MVAGYTLMFSCFESPIFIEYTHISLSLSLKSPAQVVKVRLSTQLLQQSFDFS